MKHWMTWIGPSIACALVIAHPAIRVGAGWSLHPIGAGLCALFGRDAAACALSPTLRPRSRAAASSGLDPQFLPDRAAKAAREPAKLGPAD